MKKKAEHMTHRRPRANSRTPNALPRRLAPDTGTDPDPDPDHTAARWSKTRKRSQERRSTSALQILLCLGLLEICFYHLYYWDYTLSLLGYWTDSSTGKLLLHESRGESSKRHIVTVDNSNVTAMLIRTSSAVGYDPFEPLVSATKHRDVASFFQYSSKEEMGVDHTLTVLQTMGINRSEVVERGLLDQIPPWWQIIDNYGKEPVILGMERCQTFRERVFRRHLAPVGMFSTGTNLLQQLLYDNCNSPLGPTRQRARMFNLWQAPWGKHNPAAARMHHIAKDQDFRNQSAVLPIVTIRHPYTWLHAVCSHPYSFDWKHYPEFCTKDLSLDVPVKTNYGAYTAMNQDRISESHPSVMHAWSDWNVEYMEQQEYPMLMVRFEDLVFRPKQVVEKVCECAGGKMEKSFWYLKEPANLGTGHGEHRSDLLAAVVKYGLPLSLYHQMYSQVDWNVIRDVLQDDHGLMQSIGYKP